MKKIVLLLLLLSALISETGAQTRYVVRFKNKGGSSFTLANPQAYLTQRSINRRTRYNIPVDSTDLPVTPSYVTQVKNVANVNLLGVSKWLNAVAIQTTDPNALTTINGFAFVQSTTAVAKDDGTINPFGKFTVEEMDEDIPVSTSRLTADYFNYGTDPYTEIHLHNGEFLHNIGLRGQTMQIAVLDAGFTNYNVYRSFDSININGQVLDKWNVVLQNTNLSVHSHGMQCLSTMAANIPGQFVGKAPKAFFHLYCTEDDTGENPIEEFFWSCGAERADSIGTDVISTSLGYTTFDIPSMNHTYADMNGNTTMAAIAADLAAKKGIMVFASIGNDGNGGWHFLGTPSDGDSVIAVGAVNKTGTVWSGSSYGPSSDGQVKPNLASIGLNAVVQNAGSNTVGTGTGTSFACPNMAGLGTCLWQGFPEYSNVKVQLAMQLAASKATNPDDRVGYGIPNMKNAFAILLIEYATSSATVNACNATINWTSKDVGAMKYIIERKLPGELVFSAVGQLSAATGDLLAVHSYQFNNTIVSATAGTVSYRIGQVIDTAAASLTVAYIDTASVVIGTGCVATGTGNVDPNKVAITVQPNPAAGSTVSVIIETPYAVTKMPLLVYDSKGRMVMQVNSSKVSGKKTLDLNIERLASGKYYIKVLNGDKPIGTAEWIRL